MSEEQLLTHLHSWTSTPELSKPHVRTARKYSLLSLSEDIFFSVPELLTPCNSSTRGVLYWISSVDLLPGGVVETVVAFRSPPFRVRSLSK